MYGGGRSGAQPAISFHADSEGREPYLWPGLGSSLVRAAYGAFYKAAQEIQEKGTFTYAAGAIAYGEINGLLR